MLSGSVFAKIVQLASDAIIVLDESQSIFYFNEGAESIFGYQASEVVGRPLDILLPPDAAEIHRTHVRKFAAEPVARRMMGERKEIAARRKDGTVFPAAASILKIPDGERTIFVAILRDTTERKQTEEQINGQLLRLAALRKIDTAITSSIDLQDVLKVVLEQTTTMLGVDAADILLLNQNSQTLVFTSGLGFHTEALKYTNLQLGEGYAGKAAQHRQIVSISDLRGRQTDFLRSPSFSAEGFVTYYAVPLVAKEEVKGVLEVFQRVLIHPNREWLDFLESLAGQSAIAVDNAQLFESIQRANAEIFLAYDETIEGWSLAMDLRDKETQGHTQRVTEMTVRLARAMGVSDEQIVHIRRGALLHDIGKMGVPDSVLLKPGALTDEERDIMRQHPLYAYKMLSPITYLQQALDIPYCHHEKWDGTGFPRGLKGEQIPLAARIFAVVDVWDALRSNRPYRKAWPQKKVLSYIHEQSGTHFDPQVTEVFLGIADQPMYAPQFPNP